MINPMIPPIHHITRLLLVESASYVGAWNVKREAEKMANVA
jgi:hypothetical protein